MAAGTKGAGEYTLGLGDAVASKFMNPADDKLTRGAGPLTTALEELLEQAREAATRSYSPYSGFKVGAALLLTNGATVTGTNV